MGAAELTFQYKAHEKINFLDFKFFLVFFFHFKKLFLKGFLCLNFVRFPFKCFYNLSEDCFAFLYCKINFDQLISIITFVFRYFIYFCCFYLLMNFFLTRLNSLLMSLSYECHKKCFNVQFNGISFQLKIILFTWKILFLIKSNNYYRIFFYFYILYFMFFLYNLFTSHKFKF